MSRQPVFNVPAVVVGVIVILAAVHAARLGLPDDADAQFLATAAFVPARVTAAISPDRVADALSTLARSDPRPDGEAAAGLFFLGSGAMRPWTLVSYALLHGDWAHLGLNTVWFLAFGAPLARRIGAVRFLLFCAGGAVAGAVAHWTVDTVSFRPLIGASAAVSCCMGAVARFGFRSLSAQGQRGMAAFAPRLPLASVVRDRRTRAFLLVWVVTNFVTGVLAVPLGLSEFPIAWQAHVGGFVFGLCLLPAFDPVPVAPSDLAGGTGRD